jgi:hypothetical protein
MLSLSQKSLISLPQQGGFNGREFALEPILVSLAKVLFQNVSPPRSIIRLSGIFFPLPPSSGALLFCFGNPSFNKIKYSTH